VGELCERSSTSRPYTGRDNEADFKTAAALQRLGDEGDDAWGDERAAEPLPIPGLTPNRAAILHIPGPARSRQGLTDSLFQGGGYRRPPEAFSCIPESRKAGTESFLKIIAATHRFTRGRRPRRARKGWQQPGG
jgi:hypothetical protein